MADNSTAMEIEAPEMAPVDATCMDAKLYNGAFEGDTNAFPEGIEHIELLLTPNKNTVLHIHFTAEIIHESNDFVKYIMKLCPSIFQQAKFQGRNPASHSRKERTFC